MRRSLLAIFVTLAGLLVIWQCRTRPDETSPLAPVPEHPPSTVAGPVLFQPSAAELIYVADFRVTLKGGDRSQEAKTDLTGRYRFYDVAPGKYTVCWESAGWMNGCTPEVEVTAGQSASPQPAELKPSAPDSVVWGTVRLADGSAATLVDRASGVEAFRRSKCSMHRDGRSAADTRTRRENMRSASRAQRQPFASLPVSRAKSCA